LVAVDYGAAVLIGVAAAVHTTSVVVCAMKTKAALVRQGVILLTLACCASGVQGTLAARPADACDLLTPGQVASVAENSATVHPTHPDRRSDGSVP
jgi:hypothetical protein